MTDQRIIREYYGPKRYGELKREAYDQWLVEGKPRGVSSRFFIDGFLERLYGEEFRMRQVEEERR